MSKHEVIGVAFCIFALGTVGASVLGGELGPADNGTDCSITYSDCDHVSHTVSWRCAANQNCCTHTHFSAGPDGDCDTLDDNCTLSVDVSCDASPNCNERSCVRS